MNNFCDYNYKFKTGTFDIGAGRKMRLSSVLKYQEQSGELHLSDCFGLDYKTVREKGVVFVLVNSAVKIHRMPTIGEVITLNTWNRGLKGLKFFRGYDWFDESGEKIIEGVSAFVLVSEKEHKIVKPDALGISLPVDNERVSSVSNPSKTHIPKEMNAVGSKKILFSMLDSNDHLNNAFYADFLVDFIDEEYARNVKGFTLDFVKEATQGEKIEVFTKKEDDKIFIKGACGDNICFRASVEI